MLWTLYKAEYQKKKKLRIQNPLQVGSFHVLCFFQTQPPGQTGLRVQQKRYIKRLILLVESDIEFECLGSSSKLRW